MPRLSIIIPWTGPIGPFEDTLAAVLQNRPHGCEVLVALSRPYDDPYHLTEEVTFLPPPGRSTTSLVALANHGLAAASSPVVQVLPSGYLVEESWASAALLQFEDADVAAVAPVVQHPAQRQQVISAGIEYHASGARRHAQQGRAYDVSALVRTKPFGAPLAGGFFRKQVLDALGGFDATCGDTFADVDLALALQALGLKTECEPTSVLLTTQPFKAPATFAAGLAAERVYRRHAAQYEPQAAAAAHRNQLVGECLWSLAQPWWLLHVAGRLCGKLGASGEASFAARVAQAKDQLADQEAPQLLRMPTRSQPQAQRRAA